MTTKKRYECYFCIKTAGFTLPFFDGSKLPITENIDFEHTTIRNNNYCWDRP